jgi:hypothetical protein
MVPIPPEIYPNEVPTDLTGAGVDDEPTDETVDETVLDQDEDADGAEDDRTSEDEGSEDGDEGDQHPRIARAQARIQREVEENRRLRNEIEDLRRQATGQPRPGQAPGQRTPTPMDLEFERWRGQAIATARALETEEQRQVAMAGIAVVSGAYELRRDREEYERRQQADQDRTRSSDRQQMIDKVSRHFAKQGYSVQADDFDGINDPNAIILAANASVKAQYRARQRNQRNRLQTVKGEGRPGSVRGQASAPNLKKFKDSGDIAGWLAAKKAMDG